MQKTNCESLESALIGRACVGNTDAFAELAAQASGKLFRVSLRILKNQADAEDNVQNTFCRALAKLDQFKGQSKFSTWLVRIAINEALMTIRKHRPTCDLDQASDPTHAHGEVAFELPDKKANPERAYLARELTGKALRRLPNQLRDDFVSQQLEGWTNRELAASRRVSENTMKSRMFRARTILAKHVPGLLALRESRSAA